MSVITTHSDAVLCYIDMPWVWFTTAPLEDQWGDDWDDAPYEYNAGAPYEWAHYRGVPKYDVVKIAFEGPFETPADRTSTYSRYSVEQINRGDIAWLAPDQFMAPAGTEPIHAGIMLAEFVINVQKAGGHVYVPLLTRIQQEVTP